MISSKPVKSPGKRVQCFYSQDVSKSYRNLSTSDNQKISRGVAHECYYCGKFFASSDKKRHIENCSSVPGVIYNFNNKNLITFEDF